MIYLLQKFWKVRKTRSNVRVKWSNTSKALSVMPGPKQHSCMLAVQKMNLVTSQPCRYKHSYSFYKIYILEFKVNCKIEWEVQRFPLYPLPPHMHSLTVNVAGRQHPSPERSICYNRWADIDTLSTTAFIGIHCWCLHSLSFDKCILTYPPL